MAVRASRGGNGRAIKAATPSSNGPKANLRAHARARARTSSGNAGTAVPVPVPVVAAGGSAMARSSAAVPAAAQRRSRVVGRSSVVTTAVYVSKMAAASVGLVVLRRCRGTRTERETDVKWGGAA